MNEIKTAPGTFKAFGLVRGPDGKPKFDDIHNIPGPIWAMLTDDEKEEINHERDSFSSN